jgi:hypothetical protein
LVRRRHPLKQADASDWKGPTKKYDIIKEGLIATIIVAVLILGLATTLSSPDEPPVTIASWAKLAPADFMATTASELAGTSESANYGPPYNHGHHNVQKIGINWQMLGGIRQPINSAQTFVLQPLTKTSIGNTKLTAALAKYKGASRQTQLVWANNYLIAVKHVKFVNGEPILPKINDGPVPVLVGNELDLARSGAIDADLLAQAPFYGTNYTKPLLFIEDGNYFSSIAQANHLTGTQWGVMNETGSFPGQPWLWLYTLWYQVPSFSTSVNVDVIAIYLTGAATLLLLMVPFIPGIRNIPEIVPIHKIIWRQWRKGTKKN